MNDVYWQSVHAAKAKDADALGQIIRNHKELHDYAGDDGSLLRVIDGQLSTAMDSAFRRPETRRYLRERGAKRFAELPPPD